MRGVIADLKHWQALEQARAQQTIVLTAKEMRCCSGQALCFLLKVEDSRCGPFLHQWLACCFLFIISAWQKQNRVINLRYFLHLSLSVLLNLISSSFKCSQC